MAFPTVVSVTDTVFSTAVTTHAVNLPARTAGECLLMLYTKDGSISPPDLDDWTKLFSATNPNFSQNFSAYVHRVPTTAAAGTVDVVHHSTQAAAQVYRISGWGGQVNAVVAGTAVQESLNPPNLVTGWAAEDILWIACGGGDGVDSGGVTGGPSGFSGFRFTDSGSGFAAAAVWSSRRNLNATSLNPSSFSGSPILSAVLVNVIAITSVAKSAFLEEDLAGSMPAPTGALRGLIKTQRAAGNMPSPAGTLAGKFTNKEVAGSLPAASGALSKLRLVEVAGDMPAPTGAIGRQLLLKQTLSGELGAFSGRLRQSSFVLPGSLPSPTGALSDRTLAKRLTGELSATGEVEIGHPLRLITLQGALGQPSGVLTSNAPGQVSLAGTLGAFAGALAAQQSLQRDLAGAMPAPSGTLAVKYLIELAGELSATGELDVVQFLLVSLSGAMPAPTGDLDVLYQIALAGSLPAQSGALDPLAMLRHTPRGNLPAPAGSLAVRRLYTQILVAGVLAATGSIRGVNLTARPPAMRPGAGRFNRPRPGSGRL